VDAPFLSAMGWRTLHENVETNDSQIVKPQVGGRSGHPVWFPGWAAARIGNGDWTNGLLGFLSECTPDRIRRVDLPGEALNDVDTPEELSAMSTSHPRPTP
jgi:CTP:molybdopterin cytidylyltransferase MocA